MTRAAALAQTWFPATPVDGWDQWRASIPVSRPPTGDPGGEPFKGQLDCVAWVPLAVDATPGRPAARRPLVVVLVGGDAGQMNGDELGWFALAAERRVALLAIKETRARSSALSWTGTWWGEIADHAWFDWFDTSGARDGTGQPGGVVKALDRLIGEHGDVIDPSRVFICGFAAGAGLAALLLTAWPERFAGAGLIACPAIGSAASAVTAWIPHVSPHLVYWPETVRGWAADLRRDALAKRGGKPKNHTHKVALWHGDSDGALNRGHAVALIDQFAGLLGVPVSRRWSAWFPPRLEISGQTARHEVRWIEGDMDGVRRGLRRTEFTRDGETVIQANWVDYLGHAVPVSPRADPTGASLIGETGRRRFPGCDAPSEILDFLGCR